MERAHVWVFEAEPSFPEALTIGLEREGFRVPTVPTVPRPWAVRRAGADLVLLDFMLPFVSGSTSAARYGSSRKCRYHVTAKTSEVDTVVGLEVGADDYAPSPIGCANWSRACARFCVVSMAAPTTQRPSKRSRSW